jgi:uncharacterized protein (DUF4415 family)
MTTTQRQATKLTDDGLELVEDRRDIPTFQTEAEEAEYWATHTFGDQLLAELAPAREVDSRLPPPRAPSSPITIRFESDVLHRLRALAAAKGIGYQTLLKRFVVERLFDEERALGGKG